MPHRLTLAQMIECIGRRQLSPVELVDAHLAQIDKHNPQVNAFVMQFATQARGAARQAEREGPSGRLHGIPLTIKDSFDMAGLPTLCGSQFRLHHRAPRDSAAVRRLQSAGAIILGKTNCPEFLANYESDNYITGRTNNPWNLDYTPGGSSGGESAAIAAFCSAGGIGSDGGGSIRVPAHFTGIAGLKPTPGRVSAAGHFPEISHPGGLLGVAGPMARTARDVKILFEVLAGYDIRDPFSAPVPLREPDLTALRVGVMESLLNAPVQEPLKAAVVKAAGLLADMGIPADEFVPRNIGRAPALWWFFFAQLPAPFTRQLLDGQESKAHWTGTELLRMVDQDQEISGKTVVENLGARDKMRISLLSQMEEFPVLLLPPCGVSAFRHRERGWPARGGEIGLLEAMTQVTVFNLFGMPGLVIPMMLGDNGLPIGVQLVGRPYSEELLLDLAIRMEEARGPLPGPPGY
ncbi:MAG TPA: amidase [Bryobacteraceae bacterium]|nr:amidase [Bryobacteraceae bacterium]